MFWADSQEVADGIHSKMIAFCPLMSFSEFMGGVKYRSRASATVTQWT
jgi:hypothetical protein